mgnify:CR=1 FL=1
MKIIKCTNCETHYQENEINIIECVDCKSDQYLMETESE